MKKVVVFCLLIVFFACNTKWLGVLSKPRPEVTPSYRIAIARKHIYNTSNTVKVPKEFPHAWVGLSRLKTKFVEYKPCNGTNHSIEIFENILMVNYTSESIGYPIKDICATQNGCVLTCFIDSINVIDFKFSKCISPAYSYIVTWKETNALLKWLMTPKDARHKFQLIQNPCSAEMVPEIQFEEILFDSLKTM